VKVTADLDLCQGHQMCRLEAPDVFGFDRDIDRVSVLVVEPDGSQRAAVQRAVRYCPTTALAVTD
jgi:ferredoxin